MDFVNLHCHSHASIRDSISKVPALVAKAKELGMPAVALTDHGTLASLLQLYKESNKVGIKPILGVELYVSPGSRLEHNKAHKYDHLTVIAMNSVGWSNMCTLVSESYRNDNFYYKPRVDRELLRIHNEGLIILSGCLAGHLAKAIMREYQLSFEDEDGENIECSGHNHSGEESTISSIRDTIEWYKSTFGDRYYLEVQNHGISEENTVRDTILNIANDFKIKVVATGDSHFVNEQDINIHNIMIANRDRTTILDQNLKKYPGNGYYLPTEALLKERFGTCWHAVTNTLEIAERCNVKLNLGNYQIPRPNGVTVMNEDDIFIKQVIRGLQERIGDDLSDEYIRRINEEIKVIVQMTFPSYFLMVSDYIGNSKAQGILVGPGRGSAGGSLVSYALHITDVDPVKHKLSFARFLNSGRSAIPQINFQEFTREQYEQQHARPIS